MTVPAVAIASAIVGRGVLQGNVTGTVGQWANTGGAVSSVHLKITLHILTLPQASVAVIVNVAVQLQPVVEVATPPVTCTSMVPGQLSLTLPAATRASLFVGRGELHGNKIGPVGQWANEGGVWSSFQL